MYEKLKDENYLNLGGINEKPSLYITEDQNVLDLRNLGFERPGAWTSRPGITNYAQFSNTTLLAQPTAVFEYNKENGNTFVLFDSGSTLWSYTTAPQAVAQSLSPGATVGYNLDAVIINDYFYFANQYTFQRFDGSLSVKYGIPAALNYMGSAGVTFNTSLISGFGETIIIASGNYRFRYAYTKYGPTLNTGPVGDRFTGGTSATQDVVSTISATLVLAPGEGRWLVYGITIPPAYGISSIVSYKTNANGITYFGGPSFLSATLTSLTGSTFYAFEFDQFTTDTFYQNVAHFTLIPSILQSYKNMMFLGGFSAYPSKVFNTPIGLTDTIDPEDEFDVQPGNGDKITNIFPFQNSLIFFKKKSIHQLVGDSPETLSLKDMTFEYGCVNNTAAVEFEGRLWFMDERGVCEYRGSATEIMSYPVDETLATVDKSTCRAFHIQKRQEVWFCCGTTSFVYDYNVGAWTIYDGFNIQNANAAQVLQHGASIQDLSFVVRGASYSTFSRFADDVYTDAGANITFIAKTRFHKRMGNSTQEIWRRLYMDSNSPGVTAIINFYGDYSSSSSLTSHVYLDAAQKRIDFGYGAKSLSVEMILKGNSKITINGYTIESRFLRSV